MSETQINGTEYDFTCTLISQAGKVVKLNPSSVVSLVIEESLFQIWPVGHICISSPYNVLESDWQYGGSGLDRLVVSIGPTEPTGYKGREKIEYTFSLTEEQNLVNDETASLNQKCFLLEHIDLTLLKQGFANAHEERVYTGPVSGVIGQILNRAKESGYLNSSVSWETGIGRGAEEIYIQGYVPPSHFRWLDLLQYFLRLCVFMAPGDAPIGRRVWERMYLAHKDGSLYLFRFGKDRVQQLKKWRREYMTVGDLYDKGSPADNGNNPIWAREPLGVYTTDVTSIGYNTAGTSYTNSLYMNQLAIGYDRDRGAWWQDTVRMEDYVNVFSKFFCEPFPYYGGKGQPFINVSKYKLLQEWKTISIPYKPWHTWKIAQADLFHTLNFLNLDTNINVLGQVSRRPDEGFIQVARAHNPGMAKDGGTSDDDGTLKQYDGKMLGYWYMTDVTHKFIGNTYRNELRLAKGHVGPDASANIYD